MHYSPRCLLRLTLPGAGMPIKHCYTKAGWGSSLLPHTRTQQQQAQGRVQSLRHGPNTRKDNGDKLKTTEKHATLIKHILVAHLSHASKYFTATALQL